MSNDIPGREDLEYDPAAPLDLFAWVDAEHTDWWEMARQRGGTAYLMRLRHAEEGWCAAVNAVMRLLHECPLRDLKAKVEAMYPPAPMG
jgi:hypothetical protein